MERAPSLRVYGDLGSALDAARRVHALHAVVRIEVEHEGRTACVAQGTVLIRDPR